MGNLFREIFNDVVCRIVSKEPVERTNPEHPVVCREGPYFDGEVVVAWDVIVFFDVINEYTQLRAEVKFLVHLHSTVYMGVGTGPRVVMGMAVVAVKVI